MYRRTNSGVGSIMLPALFLALLLAGCRREPGGPAPDPAGASDTVWSAAPPPTEPSVRSTDIAASDSVHAPVPAAHPTTRSDTLLEGPAPAPRPPCWAPIVEPLADFPPSGRLPDLAGDEGLPAAVRETRHLLLRAALAGDWGALDSLSRQTDAFRFTFGDPGLSPVAYWLEFSDGGDLLNDLALLLATPPSREGPGHVWPSWAGRPWDELTAADLDALRCVAGAEAFTEMTAEGRNTGLRTAIASDGTWSYLIGGD